MMDVHLLVSRTTLEKHATGYKDVLEILQNKIPVTFKF